MIATQFSDKVKTFRSHFERKYISSHFCEFLSYQSILQQVPCPYTPQQNGVFERKHDHIIDITRNLPHSSLFQLVSGEHPSSLPCIWLIKPRHLSSLVSLLLENPFIQHPIMQIFVSLVLHALSNYNIMNELNYPSALPYVFFGTVLNTRDIDVTIQSWIGFTYRGMLPSYSVSHISPSMLLVLLTNLPFSYWSAPWPIPFHKFFCQTSLTTPIPESLDKP